MNKKLARAISEFCGLLSASIGAEPNGSGSFFYCDFAGRDYLRIVRSTNGRDSAHAFIKVEDGTIWKPDGWRGPAKNFPRGNVYDDFETLANTVYLSGI